MVKDKMENSVTSVLASIATVALIVVATRWLAEAKGSPLPKTRDGLSVYGVKWRWRVVGLLGGVFSVTISVWSWHDLHRPEWGLIGISTTFVVVGIWLATGCVMTGPSGITKKCLWSTRSLPWKDITEVRLHKKHGGAIELRSGALKLIVDSRFDAFQHLLNEIEDRTQMRPTPAP
jgi:hypothetical protein